MIFEENLSKLSVFDEKLTKMNHLTDPFGHFLVTDILGGLSFENPCP